MIPSRGELESKLARCTIQQMATLYDVSVPTVYRWLQKWGINSGKKSGTSHHTTQLSTEEVIEIYESRGMTSTKELAARFKVSRSTISNIWNAKTHCHEINSHILKRRVA